MKQESRKIEEIFWKTKLKRHRVDTSKQYEEFVPIRKKEKMKRLQQGIILFVVFGDVIVNLNKFHSIPGSLLLTLSMPINTYWDLSFEMYKTSQSRGFLRLTCDLIKRLINIF